MDKILKLIFGDSIKEEEYVFPAGIPNYIRYGYDVTKLIWKQKTCLFVRPKDGNLNLAGLKKQVRTIENACGLPAVVRLERLSSLQRANLIESDIAFTSGKGQLYIPFWGSYFEEKILNLPIPSPVMTAVAQFVFLYLYNLTKKEINRINQTQLAKVLGISKSTCTRAVQQLHGLKLVCISTEGTANWISLAEDNARSLQAAFPYMNTPVQKMIYVKKLPLDLKYKISGLKALAARSMLDLLLSDAGYAISKDEEKKIDRDLMISEQDFRDFGGIILEIWKYDPFLLSESPYVDDISLLLELNHNMDERVQNELDTVRRDYGLYDGRN